MSQEAREEVHALVEHLFRHEAGRMLAALTRMFGLADFDPAEEVVQDAMVQALRQWPFRGVPDNPAAWLMRTARNKALDVLRRRTLFRRQECDLDDQAAASQEPVGDELADDQLAMIFACCHPVLPAEARIALTLKSVGGFGVAEIARAFLTQEATIAQRLVRAKRRLAEDNVPLAVPPSAELPERLDSVLRVIYLLFNEGYSAHQGEDLVRHDLCAEAIRLSLLLLSRPETALPKVHALVALMLLQASRLPTRQDAEGNLCLLANQDRSSWDKALISEGMHHLERAAAGEELSEYHVQAAIAACHAVAPSYDATDWQRVLALYDQLMAIAPSPVVLLNRAIALAMEEGPEAGLHALDAVHHDPAMRDYYLLPATRADLLLRLGQPEEAEASYRHALTLPCTQPERRFLTKRLEECRR
ncbi:MAG TPA: sigma-70 family RNA polymerase sigma factor [Gemmataceae bacterium]|nr:sigma-70 family RNA polymerase sigma factor [Gemmataceae bacterium]